MTQTAGTDAFTFAQSGGNDDRDRPATIAAGTPDTFTLVVSAPSNLANGCQLSPTRPRSASTTTDPNTANNSATVTGSIVGTARADLAVSELRARHRQRRRQRHVHRHRDEQRPERCHRRAF